MRPSLPNIDTTLLANVIRDVLRTDPAKVPAKLTVDELVVNKKLTVAGKLAPDSGWIPAHFVNGWVQQAPPRAVVGYRKIGPVVYLRGSLWGGISGSTAFTLDAGFRPPAEIMAAGGYYAPDTGNTVLIGPTGTVAIYWGTASQASLDGISFLID